MTFLELFVRHWGIDISNSAKTDKTMAEIELEMNKKVGSEYAAIIEAGETLTPSFGPNKTGIRNLGNTCYVASVLQVDILTFLFYNCLYQP